MSLSSDNRSTPDLGGADLTGIVEFREFDMWFAPILVATLLPRDYDLFGLLFGVTNYANFQPLFPERGLPADCEEGYRLQYDAHREYFFGASWASYGELAGIDWEVNAKDFDMRVHCFDIDSDGKESYCGKELPSGLPHRVTTALNDSNVYQTANRIYRVVRLKRRDALSNPRYELTLRLMRALAVTFGEENVRLVVYFQRP